MDVSLVFFGTGASSHTHQRWCKNKGVCAGLEELTDKLATPLGDEFTSTKRSNVYKCFLSDACDVRFNLALLRVHLFSSSVCLQNKRIHVQCQGRHQMPPSLLPSHVGRPLGTAWHVATGCRYLDVSKNRGKTPKMDGL